MADKYFGGIKAGSTSVTIDIGTIRKKADSTEATGIAFNTAGNIASYRRQGSARVAISLVTQTVTGAYSSGGFVEIDATNQPGIYRLDIPDAALASGVDYVVLSFVSTNNFAYNERIALSSTVIQSGDSFARLGAPAGASTAADIAAIAAKTTNIPASPAATTDVSAVPAAVLAAATAAPIASEVKKINGVTINGAGVTGNEFKP